MMALARLSDYLIPLLLAGAVAVFAAVSTIFCVLAYLGVMDRFGA